MYPSQGRAVLENDFFRILLSVQGVQQKKLQQLRLPHALFFVNDAFYPFRQQPRVCQDFMASADFEVQ